MVGLRGWSEDDVRWRVKRRQPMCNATSKLGFPTSIRKVIFLIFKEFIFLEKKKSKNFDKSNMRKLENILHIEHTLMDSLKMILIYSMPKELIILRGCMINLHFAGYLLMILATTKKERIQLNK